MEDHDHQRDEWDRDVLASVLDVLPAPPARVLDVGCGDGWLVRALHGRGYDARGVDPEAPPDDPLLTRARLEELDPSAPFDALVAVLPLHHIHDLAGAVRRMAELLVPSGTLVVIEFAWDRFDDDTARWCLEHLPDREHHGNWLHDLCEGLGERLQEGRPLGANELARTWAADHGFHSSSEMVSRLVVSFTQDELTWGPYLASDLDLPLHVEADAIAAGRIAATSFRFVGRRRVRGAPRSTRRPWSRRPHG